MLQKSLPIVSSCPSISDNQNVGIVFNIFNKNANNDFTTKEYGEEEIGKMLRLVSTKFNRITTNGINSNCKIKMFTLTTI